MHCSFFIFKALIIYCLGSDPELLLYKSNFYLNRRYLCIGKAGHIFGKEGQSGGKNVAGWDVLIFCIFIL